MAYYTYILYSSSLEKNYYGQTQDVLKRLNRHNSGIEKYSKSGIPWKLLWLKKFDTRAEAYNCEQMLKRMKSRIRVAKFILENPTDSIMD